VVLASDFVAEFARYRSVAQKALDQVPDAALNHVPAPDANSLGMLVRHVSGNLTSRFTDFLTSDGEKPWRERDEEFADRAYDRQEVNTVWASGWKVLEEQLETLTDADLDRTVHIRGVPLTVHQALCRALAHVSYHVGQIVILSRMLASNEWRWISIPKGKSTEYNQNPVLEKHPA
jgi:hypothetical protein